MTERIDNLVYTPPTTSATREPLETNLFLTQPGEFLIREMAAYLRQSKFWAPLFGEYIDDYERMDYSIRNLPVMRIYEEKNRRDFESWYVNGDIKIDIIWPPSIRRPQTQQLPKTIAGAMLQQLSREEFFLAIGEKVPGLNELGKVVTTDMTMGFTYGADDIVPLTQITANYRINLQDWQEYLETDFRTKDDPFERTLGDLRSIATTIQALRDETIEVTIGIDQQV